MSVNDSDTDRQHSNGHVVVSSLVSVTRRLDSHLATSFQLRLNPRFTVGILITFTEI